MNQLQLFLPCAAGVEDMLAHEAAFITGGTLDGVRRQRGGVLIEGAWRDALLLNLHSRLAQRVLVQLSHTMYRSENDLYEAASAVAWEIWFTTRQTFKIEVTAQHSPLKSLNFAALRVKDAVADRFRARPGVRCEHEVLEGGHYLQWDRPAAVTERLRAFAQSPGQQPGPPALAAPVRVYENLKLLLA